MQYAQKQVRLTWSKSGLKISYSAPSTRHMNTLYLWTALGMDLFKPHIATL